MELFRVNERHLALEPLCCLSSCRVRVAVRAAAVVEMGACALSLALCLCDLLLTPASRQRPPGALTAFLTGRWFCYALLVCQVALIPLSAIFHVFSI